MELGDSPATARDHRSPADDILDKLNNDLNQFITAVESGSLDQLSADDKVRV